MKTAERKNTDIKEIDSLKNSLKNISVIDKEIAKLLQSRASHCKNLRTSLRSIRSGRGISSSQIAEAIGITQGHYSDIERGRRSCTPGVISKLYEWATISLKRI